MTPKSVILRASARRDVEQALAHYLDEGGADVAVGFIDALENALRHIARNPASGSPRYGHDLTLAGLRSWPPTPYPYLIFYMEAQRTIDVWRILHARRDIPERCAKAARLPPSGGFPAVTPARGETFSRVGSKRLGRVVGAPTYGSDRRMQPAKLAFRIAGLCLLAGFLVGGSSACADFAPQSEAVRISPEPLIEIGEMEGAEEYLFSSIGQAFLLEDGRLVVSDQGVNEIRVFGPDGTFLNSIGRSGEGPGEFSGVTGLWLTPDDLIGLWDRGNLRISTFRADGELVSTNRLRVEGEGEYSVTPEVLLGPFGNGDIALASLEFGGSPDAPEAIADRWVLARFGPDGEPRGALGDLRGMRRLRGQPLPFTPLPRVAVLSDSLFAADGYEAGIDVRGPDGAVGRTITLPVVDRSAEAAAAWSALEAELRARNREMYLGMLERLPRSDEFPQIGGLLADDRGLLWVKLYDVPGDALWLGHGPAMRPGAGGEWRLIRPDGEVLGTVRMPDGLSPLHITEDRLVGVQRDALDVERLVVHGLER